jgi:hypothetical protein
LPAGLTQPGWCHFYPINFFLNLCAALAIAPCSSDLLADREGLAQAVANGAESSCRTRSEEGILTVNAFLALIA